MIFWSECCLGTKSPAARSGGSRSRILLERVQQLEKRVAELETKTPAAPVSCCGSLRERSCSPKARKRRRRRRRLGRCINTEPTESQATTRTVRGSLSIIADSRVGDVNFSTTDQRGANQRLQPRPARSSPRFRASHKVTYFGETDL